MPRKGAKQVLPSPILSDASDQDSESEPKVALKPSLERKQVSFDDRGASEKKKKTDSIGETPDGLADAMISQKVLKMHPPVQADPRVGPDWSRLPQPPSGGPEGSLSDMVRLVTALTQAGARLKGKVNNDGRFELDFDVRPLGERDKSTKHADSGRPRSPRNRLF